MCITDKTVLDASVETYLYESNITNDGKQSILKKKVWEPGLILLISMCEKKDVKFVRCVISSFHFPDSFYQILLALSTRTNPHPNAPKTKN